MREKSQIKHRALVKPDVLWVGEWFRLWTCRRWDMSEVRYSDGEVEHLRFVGGAGRAALGCQYMHLRI